MDCILDSHDFAPLCLRLYQRMDSFWFETRAFKGILSTFFASKIFSTKRLAQPFQEQIKCSLSQIEVKLDVAP